jgi:DNA-binding GntR family transcriptional regulator
MTVALYRQISEDIVKKITAGEHPVGSVLPTEMELMTDYGASRNTVRSALQQLQTMGLISRKRNRGTTVEALPDSVGGFSQSLSSLDGLVTLASTARRTILGSKEVVLDIETARELGCRPGSRWLQISMVRSEPNKNNPLGWTDAYVDPHYAQVRELAKRSPDKLLSDLIESRFGRRIESVEQTVHACALTQGLAKQLVASVGSPALRVLRRYRDASSSLVIVTRSWYPEERYSLSTTLVRRK